MHSVAAYDFFDCDCNLVFIVSKFKVSQWNIFSSCILEINKLLALDQGYCYGMETFSSHMYTSIEIASRSILIESFFPTVILNGET